uniref:Uncharacterized protein n=2 Tax=Davidia involucrata TaxID=16924 RepID=A0A5B7C6Z1_DAVIN
MPLFIATKMTAIERSSFFIPSPETYSKASLRVIGYEQVCMPYWPHYVQWCILSALPDALVDWCLLQVFLGRATQGFSIAKCITVLVFFSGDSWYPKEGFHLAGDRKHDLMLHSSSNPATFK